MAPDARDLKTFKDYQLALRSSLSNSQLEKFKNLRTNEEKIIFINGLQNFPTFPISKQENRGKNLEEAQKFKEQGNVSFQNKKYNQACWFYSQSILKCPRNRPESCEEIAIYHANRSAALYHLKEYNMAINDIDFAMNHNYPKHLLHKALDRKAQCLLALETPQQAIEVFKKTIRALDDAKLSVDERQKRQKNIQIMLHMMSKNKQSKAKITPNLSKFHSDKIEGKTNPTYEALSSGIDMEYSESMGRFGVAKQDMKAGKIILVEDPHCAVLLQKYTNKNCYHCFRRVKTLYACPSCDQVIFCSDACTKMAMTYHEIECSVLKTIWESEVSITCHISFRIIAQRKLEYFVGKRQDLQKNQHPKQFSRYKSSDYETLFNLVTHEEKRKPEDILNRVHMALFLLKCLKAGGYFDKKGEIIESENLSENEVFIAKLLLHHLQVSQFNAHEVSELQVKKEGLPTSSSEFIGGAIYPTLALLNHSCNPAVIRYFHGTKVITRLIRNVKAGEMVAENYGPIFTEIKKDNRQRVLKEQYWFDCTCEACSNDWPTISEMYQEANIRFRCTNKECRSPINVNPHMDSFLVVCTKCSQDNNIVSALKSLKETDDKFKTAETLIHLGKVDQVLEIALPMLHLLEEILVPPFQDHYRCIQLIRTCFLSKGNVYLKAEV